MQQSLAGTRRFPHTLVISWYVIAAAALGGLAASLPGYYQWYIEQPIRLHFSGINTIFVYASGVTSLLSGLISIFLAAFIFLRKPGDRAALYVSFYLLMYGFVMSGSLEMVEYLFLHEMGVYVYWVQAVLFIPTTIFLLFIFPNGIITPARFRRLLPLVFLVSVLTILYPDSINSLSSFDSKIIYSLILFLFLCGMGAQIYRYGWKSNQVERQQTKIALFGFGLQNLFLGISSINFFQLADVTQNAPIPGLLPGDLFWFLSITILPISLTLAVIRSHLWDIDIVIRRTLIYGFLTAALALLYFCSVIFMQYVFRLVGGHDSPAAIVISTLVSAGLFQPLRGRIQATIDRRFYRSKYNAQQALDRFQKNLRDRMELDQVETDLTNIVQVTVQPEWMMVWMRKAENKEG